MGDVIKLHLKKQPTREQVLQWLVNNYTIFPKEVSSIKSQYVSENIFYSWRFVKATDNNIYFANCILPGIGENEFYFWRDKLCLI